MRRAISFFGVVIGVLLLAASPSRAAVDAFLQGVDWMTVQNPLGGSDVKFHLHFTNPGPGASNPIGGGNVMSQMFGVILGDDGRIGSFDVPSMPQDSFFDVFIEVPLSSLPPSAPKEMPGGPPSPNSPCPPDSHWDGNIDVTFNGATGQVSSTWHQGQIRVCPGAGNSLIHVMTGCSLATGLQWIMGALCPGFAATLVENDKVTPAPNPLPAGWSGYISISAGAAVPVGTVCCFTIQFICGSQTSTIYMCATACDCHPHDPTIGDVDWTTLPGGMVRFHTRWLNNDPMTPSAPIAGDMMSQPFGVFLGDFGPIGLFNVPPIPPNSFFDVFIDVPLGALPVSAPKILPGGGPGPNAPCPPDAHWDGNVDINWTGVNGAVQILVHNGHVLVCPGAGNTYIHVVTGCAVATGMPWSIVGLCPGFSATLVNDDAAKSPAPAILPPGWTGYIAVSTVAAVPIGTTCCFTVVFDCGGSPGRIQICATTCNWNPQTPRLATVDWNALAGGMIRFHMRWQNDDPQIQTAPVSGNVMSQPFGAYLGDVGQIGLFSVPPLMPNSFFDIFFDVAMNQLPPSPSVIQPIGGLTVGVGCPPNPNWVGNVDVFWDGPAGPGRALWHNAQILTCPGGGNSYIHVTTNCVTATGLGATWSITGLCPGFSATLVENDQVTPAPAFLPPGWSGFICVSAAAGMLPGTTCCFKILLDCDGNPATINVCVTACECGTASVGPSAIDLGFGIRATMPNPTSGTMSIRFAIPREGETRLEMFDTGGKLVRTLVAGTLSPGPHVLSWDGLGERGQKLSPGTYFVRLRFAGRSDSRKVALVR